MTAFAENPRAFWIAAFAITGIRILTLVFSPAELGPDEAQYWFWAQTPAFGYFSKPPLIAWAIAATTGVFGDAPAAVRLSAPLFHVGAAAFLYLAANRLFGRRAAFWTGIGWLTLPGVILSSFVIATDAPLLFFWSAGIYLLARIVTADAARPADFLLLGAAIGLGMLSKYAMIYFPAAMIVALASKPFRERILTPWLALTAFAAFALFLPNIIWNSAHQFQTLSHTAANADWNGSFFKPLSLLRFLGEQFAVFGVIPFGALSAYAALRLRRRALADNRTFFLLVFALLPILVVAAQAFISRAHANWAAAAFPAALIYVTGALLNDNRERIAAASAALHGAIFVGFTFAALMPSLIAAGPLGGALKPVRGWKDVTFEIMAHTDGYDAVVVDDRYLAAEMFYYQRDSGVEIAAIDVNASTDNHYEAFVPFDPERMNRVLFVTKRDDDAHVSYRFRNIVRIGEAEADLGGGRKRRYALYGISGYFDPAGG